MLVAFQLQERFLRRSDGVPAEFLTIVRKQRDGRRVVLLEKGEHGLVGHVCRCNRQVKGVQPADGVAAVVVGGNADNYPHALQHVREKRFHGYQISAASSFDMPLSELRTEPFQSANLAVIQDDSGVSYMPLQAQQPFMPGQLPVAAPGARTPLELI